MNLYPSCQTFIQAVFCFSISVLHFSPGIHFLNFDYYADPYAYDIDYVLAIGCLPLGNFE